ELFQLLIPKYREIRVKKTKLVDDVLRLRLCEIAYQLSSRGGGHRFIYHSAVFSICVLHIGRHSGERLRAQVSRCRKQSRPKINLGAIAPNKKIVGWSVGLPRPRPS